MSAPTDLGDNPLRVSCRGFSGLDSKRGLQPSLTACRRLFGITPGVTLGIVAGLVSSTIYHGWRRPIGLWHHGRLELCFFSLEVLCLVVSYLAAVLRGPGFVPKGWRPTDDEFRQLLQASGLEGSQGAALPLALEKGPPLEDLLQFCSRCKGFKPPRAHHCSGCGRCVLSMDHHCPWTNTCVGHRNLKAFVQFVHYVPVATLHSFIVHTEMLFWLFYAWIRRSSGTNFLRTVLEMRVVLALAAWLAALVVLFMVGTLAWEMQHTVCSNFSMIEDFIVEKAEARRRRMNEQKFVYPYDLGRKLNSAAVLGAGSGLLGYLQWLLPGGRTPGEAVWPDVRKGCGHFDISTEQIAQKAQKLQRSENMTVVEGFESEGWCCVTYWLGLCFKFGCCLACGCEACGENRLRATPGDVVLVSKAEGDWYFGRLRAASDDSRHGRLDGPLGWIPRMCLNDEDSTPYEVPFQKELQGAWEAPGERIVTVNGLIVRALHSRLPFVLRDQGESVELLGCRLVRCDKVQAEWSNGEVWMKRANARTAKKDKVVEYEEVPPESKKDA